MVSLLILPVLTSRVREPENLLGLPQNCSKGRKTGEVWVATRAVASVGHRQPHDPLIAFLGNGGDYRFFLPRRTPQV